MDDDQDGAAGPASPAPLHGDRFLTPREVAGVLRVSVDTVQKAVASGSLRAVRVGRQWRILESALVSYVSGNSNVVPVPVVARGGKSGRAKGKG